MGYMEPNQVEAFGMESKRRDLYSYEAMQMWSGLYDQCSKRTPVIIQ